MLGIVLSSLVIIHDRAHRRYNSNISLPITLSNASIATRYSTMVYPSILSSSYTIPGTRLNHHLAILIGITSILWSGHVIHMAIPASRGFVIAEPYNTLIEFMSGSWLSYSIGCNQSSHIHGNTIGSGETILTFIGGISSTTGSLELSDMMHHHLSIGILGIWSGHMYCDLTIGIGNRIRNMVHSYGNNSGSLFSAILVGSSSGYDLELCISLSAISVITSVVAQHMYSIPCYVYISSEYTTVVALYVHHQWISSLLMVGSFAHTGIYLTREYTPLSQECIIIRIVRHKACIISHLSWISQWLGFHTLFVYSHNDTVNAFGVSDKGLQLEPLFAQVVQSLSGKGIYGISLAYPSRYSSDSSLATLLLPIGPADMLAHHAIALGFHVTTLILLKGTLDGNGSRMLPDKVSLGFGFPCDGPGRRGTCDISCWDWVYLASFWFLNTIAWSLFYFHWKYLTIWQSIPISIQENGSYLLGWFRDYLWFNSAPLIRGYSLNGVNDNSVFAWLFLTAHLAWATSFMFLISWRGYWQELIETISYLHLHTPIVSEIWNSNLYSPLALSIVQARLVGLVHFTAGFILTYSAFVLATTK